MRGARHARSNRRGARLLRLVERLFVIGGAAALVWCVFIVTDAYVVQRLARETLESMPRVKAPLSTSSNARSKLARGTPLAELSIPRVGLSAVVLHCSDAHTLRLGLGHIENTPLPGESGNVAIAGHRDSFFRPLRNVQVGDDILLDTPQGRVHYRVSSFRVVNSYEVSVLGPTRDATLTLVTCYPFWFIGQAPDRFVVRATRVEDPAAVAATSAGSQTSEPNRESGVDGASSWTNEARGADLGASSHVHRSIPSESIAFAVRGANDDEALVREAVEHFRLTYNARLAGHGAAGSDGLMTFHFCRVAVAGKTATATCSAAAPSPESLSSPVWTFRLGRIGGEWTITSVGMM
jgi:sortase A